MLIPQDLEYVIHRPGNPKTHSLANGYLPQENAALHALKLAQTWLRDVPFVGIQLTRFKILILISGDGKPHDIDEFSGNSREHLHDHSVVHQTPTYLDQQIASIPEHDIPGRT